MSAPERWVEVQRLLGDLAAAADELQLALDLGLHPALQEPERVHVLQLGLGAQRRFAGGADRHVGVAAQRSLVHVHVGHAQVPQRHAQQPQPLRGVRGRAQVGLGHDLHQRRAAAVEVHDACLGGMDATRRAGVDELGGVLLQVHTVDAHLAQAAVAGQRNVVLGDLVALGQVGIEVVLAVEDRTRRQLAAQGHADHEPEVHGLGVRRGQRAGVPQADRAGERVGVLAERQLAATEHLGPGAQLHVDLQPDDGLVCALGHGVRHAPGSRRSRWPARARTPRPGSRSR